MSDIDWPVIRLQYEQGISQRSLAAQYGVSQASISRHASKERWRIMPVSERIIDTLADTPPPKPLSENEQIDVLDVAYALLLQISTHAHSTLEPKDIKSITDALSQIHKIKLTSASDKPTESGLPHDLLDYLSMDDLDVISDHQKAVETILNEARARKLEAEQGIKTIGKKAI